MFRWQFRHFPKSLEVYYSKFDLTKPFLYHNINSHGDCDVDYCFGGVIPMKKQAWKLYGLDMEKTRK